MKICGMCNIPKHLFRCVDRSRVRVRLALLFKTKYYERAGPRICTSVRAAYLYGKTGLTNIRSEKHFLLLVEIINAEIKTGLWAMLH